MQPAPLPCSDDGGVTPSPPSPPRLRRNESHEDCVQRVEAKRTALKVVLTDDDSTRCSLATLMARRIVVCQLQNTLEKTVAALHEQELLLE